MTDDALIDVLAMSSRSGVGVEVHTVRDIDPGEPLNMPVLLAFE